MLNFGISFFNVYHLGTDQFYFRDKKYGFQTSFRI